MKKCKRGRGVERERMLEEKMGGCGRMSHHSLSLWISSVRSCFVENTERFSLQKLLPLLPLCKNEMSKPSQIQKTKKMTNER
jgi:hypothetical protein